MPVQFLLGNLTPLGGAWDACTSLWRNPLTLCVGWAVASQRRGAVEKGAVRMSKVGMLCASGAGERTWEWGEIQSRSGLAVGFLALAPFLGALRIS